jgi:tripartite-type tricarboxylate transporter receptor subunit TctC
MGLGFQPSRRRLLLAGMAAVLPPVSVQAQGGAQGAGAARTIRLVVTASGGDALARLLASQLSQQLGTPVVVEPRAGVVGVESVARSAPDGHTLLLAHTGTLALQAVAGPRPPGQRGSDFTTLGPVASLPQVLLVPAASPMHNVPDLLMHARFGSQRLAYGSTGAGSAGHLAGELLQEMASLKMQHVPYKGAAQVLTDLLSGQVDLMFAALPQVLPQLESGRVRALAVTGARRSAALPGSPTLAEAGVKGYECAPVYGLLVPRATPADVAAPLGAALGKVLESASMRDALRQEGAETLAANTDFQALLQTEIDRWSRLLAKAGMRPE